MDIKKINVNNVMFYNEIKKVHRVGIEPTRITAVGLKSTALTTRPSVLVIFFI
jgi:hypothetical protein